MLYLYQASTSVCPVKVRVVLAEKGLAYEGEVLDLQRGDQHRPDYAKLNPNEAVPTLVHDGRAIIESTLIIEYLDETFPAPPPMPAGPFGRAMPIASPMRQRRLISSAPKCWGSAERA